MCVCVCCIPVEGLQEGDGFPDWSTSLGMGNLAYACMGAFDIFDWHCRVGFDTYKLSHAGFRITNENACAIPESPSMCWMIKASKHRAFMVLDFCWRVMLMMSGFEFECR